MGSDPNYGPLTGVRVLELGTLIAGPFCGKTLADFGAEVIKLEPKGEGDISRAWSPPLPGGERSYFVSLHRNKKGIAIDLNASTNAYGAPPAMDPRVVDAFERWGMRWGGDFSVPDGMHFEWYDDTDVATVDEA